MNQSQSVKLLLNRGKDLIAFFQLLNYQQVADEWYMV